MKNVVIIKNCQIWKKKIELIEIENRNQSRMKNTLFLVYSLLQFIFKYRINF